ncbi:DUF6077 domain-containing protein [Nocardioides speluncae]|uniref:DUF6077 domain-containing protein n=1 Tax=Nocardioides speluncae TaxID=2670337 RepID=UPI000D686C7B|nr:DUF6077 domain-containing protein [Nocardioides speluncae]
MSVTKLRAGLDGAMDAIVLSLALWTLLYCLGLATQWSLWPSGWLWLVATVTLLAWRVRAETSAAGDLGFETVAAQPPQPAADGTSPRLPLLCAGIALAAVGAVAGLFWSKSAFPAAWGAATVAVALLTAWIWLRLRATGAETEPPLGVPEPRPDDGGLWAHLGVLAISAGLAVSALFIHLEDGDDAYYVNRSVWVAEHGNAAIRDTMFGAEEYISPYGGGIPIASIEAQIGVVAHMLGIRAGTATYLIAGPVFSLLAGWAIWRLVRAWAPRRVFLVYAASIAFLMLSGDSTLGNFWIVRMWQGKVMAICFLMPLIWAYVTDVVESRRAAADRTEWWPVFMLLAAGTAFFGLTPTAVVWGPLMSTAILLAALLVRSGQLAIASGALAVGPVLSGTAVIVFSSDVGGKDPAKETLTAYESFVRVLGETNPMVAVSLLGLAVAPLLVRFGTPTLVAGSSALASMAIFAPGIMPLANAVTGSGPILWRMLFCAPIPVLVGLLASAPAPAWLPRGRLVPALAGVALLSGLALGGRPIWAYTDHVGPVWVDTRPQWKMNRSARDDVALLVDQGVRGDVLLPPRQMRALAMYSTRAFPIVPDDWFIDNIGEPQAKTEARQLLFRVAEGDNRNPSIPAVRRSLELLGVDVACVGSGPNGPRILAVYKRAGYGQERRYGALRCVTPQQ